ncbi:hypothetical protein DPMN_141296 [Dreissena polymorpha]|uniref:Uncharacterized protein n=1 Tax=Dreissena polymorpha TaxID=45954 RepID=A0A9D4JI57_DREPO|nr:hypothetical protein DPMN_141296 [Dreissena polymorpha]
MSLIGNAALTEAWSGNAALTEAWSGNSALTEAWSGNAALISWAVQQGTLVPRYRHDATLGGVVSRNVAYTDRRNA